MHLHVEEPVRAQIIRDAKPVADAIGRNLEYADAAGSQGADELAKQVPNDGRGIVLEHDARIEKVAGLKSASSGLSSRTRRTFVRPST